MNSHLWVTEEIFFPLNILFYAIYANIINIILIIIIIDCI